MSKKRVDELSGTETMGHDFDGIEELNHPMPRWWLITFYLTIAWGIGYTVLFPAWPGLSGASKGVLEYSTRGEVAADILAHEAKNANLVDALLDIDLTFFDPSSDLHRYAVARGGSVFRAQCSQCHGSGAAGATGYPNLLDNDWLWGGSLNEIADSVRHGIRNDTDENARYSEMPKFGEILEPTEIGTLVNFILESPDFGTQTAGSVLYANNCASCHGDVGLGDREQGAPNLVDAIWLYGDTPEAISESVTNARFGVMPAWGQRLTEADVRAVSTYVHSLGGGE